MSRSAVVYTYSSTEVCTMYAIETKTNLHTRTYIRI